MKLLMMQSLTAIYPVSKVTLSKNKPSQPTEKSEPSHEEKSQPSQKMESQPPKLKNLRFPKLHATPFPSIKIQNSLTCYPTGDEIRKERVNRHFGGTRTTHG